MSSDKIKDALTAAYPGTSEAQWKRRSKAKVAGGQRRTFENTVTGEHVDTIEAPDGTITLGGVTTGEPGRPDAKPQAAPVPLYDPALTAAVTATGQAEILKLVEAVEGVVEIGDTDSITPAPSARAERNAMVPGSKWVFNTDVTITTWEPSSAFEAMYYNRSIDYRVREDRANQMAKAGTAYVEKVLAVVPKGTTFEVVGKFSTSASSLSGKKSYEKNPGIMVPVSTEPRVQGLDTVYVKYDRTPAMPFTQIRDHISPLSVPETLVYVLRDTATGEYFGGWKMLPHRDPRWSNNGELYTSDVPKMVTKFSSAKKYKNASAVKASIRDFTGYNDGINDSGEEINYIFADGKKKMDLSATWEMVAVDKVTGKEKEILDVQNWYRDLLRLRTLTQGCGPAVRAAYKKGEGKGYGAIIQFENRDRGLDFRGKPYDEVTPFEEADDGGKSALAAIKEATDAMGSKFDRVKLQSNVAVACTMADAMAAKMTVSHPDLDITIYDFNTLEKIVDNQPRSRRLFS